MGRALAISQTKDEAEPQINCFERLPCPSPTILLSACGEYVGRLMPSAPNNNLA